MYCYAIATVVFGSAPRTICLLHVHEGRTDLFEQSDGLSGNYVQSIFEDREGNIWVSTLNGLDRFRDLAVSNISAKQGLSSSGVLSVLAATDGSVWLGTRDGLNRWNDGRMSILRKGSGGLPDNPHCLFQDDHGRIWVSTNRGIGYLDNGRFISVDSMPAGAVHSIASDSSGNLWISQDQALLHLSGGSIVERIPWAELGHKSAAATLLPDPAQGGLWLGFFRGGLAHFKDRRVRELRAGANINNLYLARDGTLWAATEGGLARVKDDHVATLTTKNGLPCDDVNWVVEDDGHTFWLYTACGLVRIRRSELDAWAADPRRTIQLAVFDSSDGVSIHSTMVSAYSPRVAKSTDGKLWFVSGEGVSVIDPRHLPFNKIPPCADRTNHRGSQDLRDFFELALAPVGTRS
jgi:ligand-binding sensor domain-containing protein